MSRDIEQLKLNQQKDLVNEINQQIREGTIALRKLQERNEQILGQNSQVTAELNKHRGKHGRLESDYRQLLQHEQSLKKDLRDTKLELVNIQAIHNQVKSDIEMSESDLSAHKSSLDHYNAQDVDLENLKSSIQASIDTKKSHLADVGDAYHSISQKQMAHDDEIQLLTKGTCTEPMIFVEPHRKSAHHAPPVMHHVPHQVDACTTHPITRRSMKHK